jgi:nitroreductase
MTPRDLTPDELLSTTRTVRKRLDLARPVERELIEECLDLAFQAPTGGNLQGWHFVLVTEPDRKKALASLYRKSNGRTTRPGFRPGTSGSWMPPPTWPATSTRYRYCSSRASKAAPRTCRSCSRR